MAESPPLLTPRMHRTLYMSPYLIKGHPNTSLENMKYVLQYTLMLARLLSAYQDFTEAKKDPFSTDGYFMYL